MRTKLLFAAITLAAFSSCTTMYKTGQTPDDVYFSPVRGNLAPVADTRDENEYVQPNKNSNYYSSEDRTLRMGVTDYRYRYLDQDYGYSPYMNYGLGNSFGGYGNNYGGYNSFGSNYGHNYSNYGVGLNNYGNDFYNPYYSNSYYYNPYYSSYPIFLSPATPLKISTPRMANLSGYGRSYNTNNNAIRLAPHPTEGHYNNINNSYNNTGVNNSNGRTRNSGIGNLLNRVLSPASSNNRNTNVTPSNNNNNNDNNAPVRSYTPAPSSSSNSSSGSGSSGSAGGGRISRP